MSFSPTSIACRCPIHRAHNGYKHRQILIVVETWQACSAHLAARPSVGLHCNRWTAQQRKTETYLIIKYFVVPTAIVGPDGQDLLCWLWAATAYQIGASLIHHFQYAESRQEAIRHVRSSILVWSHLGNTQQSPLHSAAVLDKGWSWNSSCKSVAEYYVEQLAPV